MTRAQMFFVHHTFHRLSPSLYRMSCLRKPTRPTIVNVPRRAATQELSAKQSGPKPVKRVRFSSPETKHSAALPQRVIVSSYATDARSILRDILSEKGLSSTAASRYTLRQAPGQTPPLPSVQPTPQVKSSDLELAVEGMKIPVIYRSERTIHRPAFPEIMFRRLWKLKPGLYDLVAVDRPLREVLLRIGNNVVRTHLPRSLAEPPATKNKTCLEIGPRKDGLLRVTAKWISL